VFYVDPNNATTMNACIGKPWNPFFLSSPFFSQCWALLLYKNKEAKEEKNPINA
jgi:hypothetical protein